MKKIVINSQQPENSLALAAILRKIFSECEIHIQEPIPDLSKQPMDYSINTPLDHYVYERSYVIFD